MNRPLRHGTARLAIRSRPPAARWAWGLTSCIKYAVIIAVEASVDYYVKMPAPSRLLAGEGEGRGGGRITPSVGRVCFLFIGCWNALAFTLYYVIQSTFSYGSTFGNACTLPGLLSGGRGTVQCANQSYPEVCRTRSNGVVCLTLCVARLLGCESAEVDNVRRGASEYLL